MDNRLSRLSGPEANSGADQGAMELSAHPPADASGDVPLLNCRFVHPRPQFFSVLSKKLGREFVFAQSAVVSDIEDAEVVLIGIPAVGVLNQTQAFSLISQYAQHQSGLPIIAFLPVPDDRLIQLAFHSGAYDYVSETASMEEMRIVLRRAAKYFRLHHKVSPVRKTVGDPIFGGLQSSDPKMIATYQLASRVANTDANILVTGETGVGKEVLARAIHAASSRASEPFVAVSCASLPETLIESELFGHERGAFTGALRNRRGRFEAAGRGTVLLDEVSEVPPGMQTKLLRVLQEKNFERLGSNDSVDLRARVICASNRDLSGMIRAGQFRSDLYYRINTISIEIPPLRARTGDIALLAQTFLDQFAERHQRPGQSLCASALAALRSHSWPGNVRELQHVMEHAVLMCDGNSIEVEHLPQTLFAIALHEPSGTFEAEIKSHKRKVVQRALQENNYRRVGTARALKISRASLHRLMRELDISDVDRVGDHSERSA